MTLLRIPRILGTRRVSNKSKVQLIRDQFDFFWSSRARKTINYYNFYARLWEPAAFREFLNCLRNNILNRNRKLLLSAVGLFAFDWDKERISLDSSVQEFFDEFERIEYLKTLANFTKNGPKESEEAANRRAAEEYKVNDMDSWEFYVQKKSMITWRREEEEGHYAYKVYVSYPDITAEDFLFVQTDIAYRREWDDSAVTLDVVETNSSDESQIVYWEMMWPKLFSNRDYVFIRKHFVDRQRNLILIVNKSTKHPSIPVKAGKQRVKEYWSFMVIKPKTTFNEPGLEFILTYYDNPGIKIPKYVTSWVAQRQLPDFIEKLYNATVCHAERKTSMKWGKNRDPGFEYPSDVRLDQFEGEAEMKDNVNKSKEPENSPENPEDQTEEESHQPSSKSWWNFLLRCNYLH